MNFALSADTTENITAENLMPMIHTNIDMNIESAVKTKVYSSQYRKNLKNHLGKYQSAMFKRIKSYFAHIVTTISLLYS
jgi:hypothetical protein